MVDARSHQGRRAAEAGQEDVEGHFDAIDRCARAGINLYTTERVGGFTTAHQTVVERQQRGDGTRIARTWAVGSHHQEVGQGAETFNQGVDALGLIAVVVGKENKRTHKRRMFWDKF